MRGKGLKRSHSARVAHRLGAAQHPDIAAILKAGILGHADLSQFLPPRLDQGQTSTCHAHSMAAGLYTAFAAKGPHVPPLMTFVPSPFLIAATTYADVRARSIPVGEPLPPLVDGGAELQDDADAVAKWGVAPMGPQVEGRNSDCPSAQEPAFPEPDVPQLLQAGQRLVGGEYAIPIDSGAPETIAASLDAGIPVWVGGLVGQAYESLGPNDIAQPTPDSDTTAGGHAQLLAAYRTTGAELQFLVVNSWGDVWALNGTVWASQDWVGALWNAWPMTVQVAS
jgi:hypothetical protein